MRCPGCGRKTSNTMRQSDDPRRAFLIEACCDRCCQGHKDCGTTYYDAKGQQVTPPGGR